MKGVSIALLGIICSTVASMAIQEGTRAASAQSTEISLCDLIAHPNNYAGRPVTVRATLESGMERSVFVDDSCNPAPNNDKLVLATLVSTLFQSPTGKKLSKLLKKKGQADVTVVGVFNDPGGLIGHQLCCRYELEVQQLLTVQEVKAPPR